MKIFVTGASGLIGSAVTDELIRAGHEVIGLARSDRSAETIARMGPPRWVDRWKTWRLSRREPVNRMAL